MGTFYAREVAEKLEATERVEVSGICYIKIFGILKAVYYDAFCAVR